MSNAGCKSLPFTKDCISGCCTTKNAANLSQNPMTDQACLSECREDKDVNCTASAIATRSNQANSNSACCESEKRTNLRHEAKHAEHSEDMKPTSECCKDYKVPDEHNLENVPRTQPQAGAKSNTRCCSLAQQDASGKATVKLDSNASSKCCGNALGSPLLSEQIGSERCSNISDKACSSTNGECCATPEEKRCDEKCIRAYAIHDCTVLDHDSHSDSFTDEVPCGRHLQAAMDKYGAMLKNAICLCRNASNTSIVNCCAQRSFDTTIRQRKPFTTRSSSTTSQKKDGFSDRHNIGKQCCSNSMKAEFPTIAAISSPTSDQKAIPDIEASARYEDVLVNVNGMTCTGCEKELSRVLGSIKGVSGVRVVFVTGRAEFKVDNALVESREAIAQAQKMSGFAMTRIRRESQSIDLLIPKATALSFSKQLPSAITDMDILDKSTTRIFYDPNQIGARAILELFNGEAQLAPVNRHDELSREKKHLYELGMKTALAVVLTVPVCVFAWADTRTSEHVKAITSLGLATLVQAIAVTEFYWKAGLALLRSRTVELDMLVVISITAAYVYSVVAFAFLMAGRPLAIAEFFETSTLLIALVLLGRFLASFARAKAVASVSLRSLQVTMVTLAQLDGSETDIDARLLQVGDVFRVHAHSRIPTDGIVLSGASDVDESMLTGESLSIAKATGAKIIAGTMNGGGPLTAKVDRLPGQNTITDIAKMVDEAQASKPYVQDLADKIAGYFTSVVLTIALIAFIVWIPISLRLKNQSTSTGVVSALSYAIAVLSVSCPCALGLAVPLVLIITGGVSARRGIIIKSASASERAWSVTDVVFDKTGTLTTGNLNVFHIETALGSEATALPITLALSKLSNHPISRAVASHLEDAIPTMAEVTDSRSFPGKGVEARFHGDCVRAGSPYWLEVENNPIVAKYLDQDFSLLCVRTNDHLLAVIALKSTLRPEASSVIRKLHLRGITTHLLSGDAETAVTTAGNYLGISNIHFRQSPLDKSQYIKRLTTNSKRRVLFCGDGMNDAVAVAQADVGVCVGAASDITAGSADVTLLGSLDGVVTLLDLSRAAFRRIIFNFIWSGLYNIVAILFAAGAFVVSRLPPAYAGLGEIVSVLPVILVSATMLLSGRTA